MVTLTDFLLDRIAEDEAVARTAEYGYIERQLAECDAKRRIVQYHEVKHRREGVGGFNCFTAKTLALPYADHPDYREEWKP